MKSNFSYCFPDKHQTKCASSFIHDENSFLFICIILCICADVYANDSTVKFTIYIKIVAKIDFLHFAAAIRYIRFLSHIHTRKQNQYRNYMAHILADSKMNGKTSERAAEKNYYEVKMRTIYTRFCQYLYSIVAQPIPNTNKLKFFTMLNSSCLQITLKLCCFDVQMCWLCFLLCSYVPKYPK